MIERELGLDVSEDTAVMIRLSACKRVVGEVPECSGWHTMGSRQKVAGLAAVLGIETGWPEGLATLNSARLTQPEPEPEPESEPEPEVQPEPSEAELELARRGAAAAEQQATGAAVQIQRVHRGRLARNYIRQR